MASVLSYVQAPASLKTQIKFNSKKQSLILHLQQLLSMAGKTKFMETNPLVVKTRLTLQMTEFVCNLIENLCPLNNKGKYDKKILALEVLAEVYDLTDDEKKTVESQIQYIYDSDLIVRIPIVNQFVNSIIPFIKKTIFFQNV